MDYTTAAPNLSTSTFRLISENISRVIDYTHNNISNTSGVLAVTEKEVYHFRDQLFGNLPARAIVFLLVSASMAVLAIIVLMYLYEVACFKRCHGKTCIDVQHTKISKELRKKSRRSGAKYLHVASFQDAGSGKTKRTDTDSSEYTNPHVEMLDAKNRAPNQKSIDSKKDDGPGLPEKKSKKAKQKKLVSVESQQATEKT